MPKWFVTCKLGLCFFGIMPSTQLLPVGVLVIMKFNQRRNNFSLIISDQYNCLQDCPITNMIGSKPKYGTESVGRLHIKTVPQKTLPSAEVMIYMECFYNI